ncbi:MAG: hypothetical protein DLM72_12530 [Candidatus Nitrosopolaris wilkensis]|nr:MAG: hypothetical protein DLM72_12530 [Candidatus Nitrosopolaris wilkensis]
MPEPKVSLARWLQISIGFSFTIDGIFGMGGYGVGGGGNISCHGIVINPLQSNNAIIIPVAIGNDDTRKINRVILNPLDA